MYFYLVENRLTFEKILFCWNISSNRPFAAIGYTLLTYKERGKQCVTQVIFVLLKYFNYCVYPIDTHIGRVIYSSHEERGKEVPL